MMNRPGKQIGSCYFHGPADYMRQFTKFLIPLGCLFLIGTQPVSAVDDEALEIGIRLAANNGMIDVQALAEKMTEYQLEREPALKPFRHVLVDFFVDFYSSDEVYLAMGYVYAEHFTLEELKELETLLRNPLIAKLQRETPKLLPVMLGATEELLFSRVGDLEARVAAEAERMDQAHDEQE